MWITYDNKKVTKNRKYQQKAKQRMIKDTEKLTLRDRVKYNLEIKIYNAKTS